MKRRDLIKLFDKRRTKMTKAYPVILTPAKIGDGKGYVVHVPDLEIDTQGCDLAEAINMARDAIGLWGICEQDDGREIP